MNDRWGEALSRLIDGDEVDPKTLADALEAPESRDLLVDLARARVAVRADTAVPGPAFYAATAGAARRQMPRRVAPTTGMSLRLAAALAVAAALAGFGADTWRHRRAESPPRVERVLRFEPSEWTMAKGSER